MTLTEAQNINRSLLELGNVISALMQQSTHVPYRSVPDVYCLVMSWLLSGNANWRMLPRVWLFARMSMLQRG